MVDLLGPAATNAVTARPADDRTIGADDTFCRDCTSPSAQDGTQIKAAWLNALMQQIRRAIRGMGVAENNADDDMLLKAIRAASASQLFVAAQTQPTHLEILATSSVFAFTTTTGQTVINAGQKFVWRGLVMITTDQFDLSARTFSTLSNKTYHLRWHASGTGDATPAASYPNGRFVLKDLADASYNPTSAVESNTGFDGKYDDALIARIVTNGANALTVTPLLNKAVLSAVARKTTCEWNTAYTGPNAGTFNGLPRLTATLNWSRVPGMWVAANLDCAYPASNTKSIVAFLDSSDGAGATLDTFPSPTRYVASAVVFGYDNAPEYSYKSGSIKMNALA